MKRILAALALLLIFSVPAYSAVALINGGGTGGLLASGTNNSTITTVVTAATTVDAPIGSLITIGLGVRTGASTYTGCVDTAGNTYSTPINKSSGGGESASFSYALTTIDLPIGSTFTCTSAATGSKGIMVAAFSGAAASPLDAASATPTAGNGTAVSVGPTGTLACPASGNCEVLIGFFATFAAASVTEDAAFTTFGSLTANASNTHMAYKIVAVNTAITYAPTNATSGFWAAFLEAFVQSTAVSAVYHGLSSAGAGK